MPGLRNAAGGIRSYASFAPYFPTTTTTTTADMHIPAPPPPQQSWENLVPSSHNNYFRRPSSQQRSVHRPLQWLHQQQQHRRGDLGSNFLGTNPNTNTNNTINNTNNNTNNINSINNQHHQQQPRHPLISHGSNDSDDLQAMVHDFIENDSVDYMDGADSDGAPPSLKLTDNLQMLTSPYGALERELHTDVRLLLLTINEDTDLICDPEGFDCKGGCTKRFLVKHLKVAGYSASVCKSKWISAGRVPGGEYEYIDVMFNGGQAAERMIVDVDFREQFEIARPTPNYEAALKVVPTVFVGTPTKLRNILELMSEAAKSSLKQNDMYLPPWRTLDYMSAKWLSNFERKTNPVAIMGAPIFKGPCSLHRRDKRSASAIVPIIEAKHCGDQLRRTKVSLIAEVKGLGALPRGRSSRANLLLRTAL